MENEARRRAQRFSENSDAGDYDSALAWLSSEERAEGLLTLDAKGLLSPADFQQLLRDWWTDCDAVGDTVERFVDLFRRTGYVTDTGRRFEGTVTIYRGNVGEDPRLGISWTLSKAKARWFALYLLGPRAAYLGLQRRGSEQPVPTVWRGGVAAEDILGYFGRRRESEVVVAGADVHNVKVALRPRVFADGLQPTG